MTAPATDRLVEGAKAVRLMLGAGLLAACASPPPPERPPLELAPLVAMRAADYPGAAGALAGFAAADDDASMRVGDAALLGLELHQGGAIERQLLLLEVEDLMWESVKATTATDGVAKPTSFRVRRPRSFTITQTAKLAQDGSDAAPETVTRSYNVYPVKMRLQRLDADGKPLRTSSVTLFEEPLATGFWPYSRTDAEPRDTDMAFALTQSLQELAGSDPVLQELLLCVVEAPSLWSMATNFGIKLVMRWGSEQQPPQAVAIDLPSALGAEARSAALDLAVNGTSASWVTLVVSKPAGASRVCGGLVGAIAQHPRDPQRFVVVRLLATRRGT